MLPGVDLTPLEYRDILKLYELEFGAPSRIIESIEGVGADSAVRYLNRVYLFRKALPIFCYDAGSSAFMDKLSAYLQFHWEADSTFQRSFLLVLLGHYQNGFTLLRSGLDIVLEGAVLQCLSQRRLLARQLDTRTGRDLVVLQQYLQRLAAEDPGRASEMDSVSVHILDIVGKEVPYPKTSTVDKLFALSHWGILESAGDVQLIHSNLSKSVHGEFRFTDVGRTNEQNPETLYNEPILPESSQEYMAAATDVLSLAAIVMINLASQCLPPEHVNERMRLLKDSSLLEAANLEQVRQLVKKLAG